MSHVVAARDDWTEPGVYEVAQGVHRVPLPLPNDSLRAVNVYVLVGEGTVVLIDSGWALLAARQRLEEALRTLGLGLSDISRFLVTHAHRDHYTQAIGIRREFGTRISLGAGERASLDKIQLAGIGAVAGQELRLLRCGASGLFQLLSEGPDRHSKPDPEVWQSPDDWLVQGPLRLDSGRKLNVVETPGHTRGHVVFHDPAARLLFAGDHVLPTITPSIGFESAPSSDPLGEFLRSLALVRQMPDATLLPAHGRVAPSVHARVDELVDHHGRRLELIGAAVSRGADTAVEVAGQLRWTRRGVLIAELDPFNQMLAVLETGAHLDLLAAQGRLVRQLDGDVYRYRPV